MGLVLDSSVVIAEERAQRPITRLLRSVSGDLDETEFVLSSITIMELEHGWHRATTAEIAQRRRRYIDEVCSVIPSIPFTPEIGRFAGGLEARMKMSGLSIETADLLIGATALFYGYSIGTRNVRHFNRIPNLRIVSL